MVVCEPLAIETHPGRWLFSPSVAQRTLNGRRYVDFEFTAKNRNYTRHALASVTVGNGEHCIWVGRGGGGGGGEGGRFPLRDVGKLCLMGAHCCCCRCCL
jgi:hypothetical protein